MAILDYTVVDLEMTGLDAKKDKVIEIGAVRVRQGKVAETYATFLDVDRPLPQKITELTGISPEMLATGLAEDVAMQGLLDFVGEDILLGHNFTFDYRFILQWAANHKIKLQFLYLDTLKMARGILPADQKKSLEALCTYFEIPRKNAHRALDDALETHVVYQKLCDLYDKADEPEKLSHLFCPKPLLGKAKKISPATAKQCEQIKKYRALHGLTDPIDFGSLTRSEASRLMDMYYLKYGR